MAAVTTTEVLLERAVGLLTEIRDLLQRAEDARTAPAPTIKEPAPTTSQKPSTARPAVKPTQRKASR